MNPPRGAEWALLSGNFALGCGLPVVASCLDDLVRGLDVSVPVRRQLSTLAAASMCFGAPLLAAWPLAQSVRTMAIVSVTRALGSFACNSAQQVRASRVNPTFASALIALSGIGLAWIVSAIVLSIGVARQMRGQHGV